MNEPVPQEISLHDAADRLGVHYMTAYRYVKTGHLRATQRGRRWMVEADDLATFGTRPLTETELAPTVDTMRLLLQSGNEDTAWDFLVASGLHEEPLRAQQELIAPALREIGTLWEHGKATIGQEHVATGVATRLMARLGTPRRRGRRVGTVVACCPPGDPHTLATALFSNLVRSAGAEVIDLGTAPSVEAVVAAVEAIVGPTAIAISVTAPGGEDATKAMARALRQLDNVRAVLIGGAAVPDEAMARDLGSDLFCPSAEIAAAKAAASVRS